MLRFWGRKKDKLKQNGETELDEVDGSVVDRPLRFEGIHKLDRNRVSQVHTLDRASNPESVIVRRAQIELEKTLDTGNFPIISLHGASKQGKTTILRSVLTDARPHFLYLPGARPTREQLYRNIIANAEIGITAAKTYATNEEVRLGNEMIGGVSKTQVQETTVNFVDADLRDVNFVGRTLMQKTNARIIVVDNFHHVDEEVQAELATDFVVLATMGFKVVLAGTWKEHDYLELRNSDLREYHQSICIDPWDEDELRDVVYKGANALNFEIPKKVASQLAVAASGSVSALQAITRQWYEHHIDREHKYTKGSPGQQVTAAAQVVARERTTSLAEGLAGLSKWGSIDNTGRHQVSFIVEAMLNLPPQEFATGVSINRLEQSVLDLNQEWARERQVEPKILPKAELMSKLKSGWMAFQVVHSKTPCFVYETTSDRLLVNDAMLQFVHRTQAAKLRSEFRTIMKDQVAASLSD